MGVVVHFTAKLPVELTKRKKWVVATCPVLDLHSQGKTERKAKKNLSDALSLFFVSCFERGTLDAVLKQCGFKAHTPTIHVKRPVVSKEDYINVPIPFLVNQDTKTECHA